VFDAGTVLIVRKRDSIYMGNRTKKECGISEV